MKIEILKLMSNKSLPGGKLAPGHVMEESEFLKLLPGDDKAKKARFEMFQNTKVIAPFKGETNLVEPEVTEKITEAVKPKPDTDKK